MHAAMLGDRYLLTSNHPGHKGNVMGKIILGGGNWQCWMQQTRIMISNKNDDQAIIVIAAYQIRVEMEFILQKVGYYTNRVVVTVVIANTHTHTWMVQSNF